MTDSDMVNQHQSFCGESFFIKLPLPFFNLAYCFSQAGRSFSSELFYKKILLLKMIKPGRQNLSQSRSVCLLLVFNETPAFTSTMKPGMSSVCLDSTSFRRQVSQVVSGLWICADLLVLMQKLPSQIIIIVFDLTFNVICLLQSILSRKVFQKSTLKYLNVDFHCLF